MKILAFDTSSNSLSISLLENNQPTSEFTLSPNSNQSELLIPEIEKILNENQTSYQDLDLIAATNGPGSFTGSRIGLTAARTIKLATKLPLILLNSCQIIAFKHRKQLSDHQQIFVALDAKANEIFYATYNTINDIKSSDITPQITTLDTIQSYLPKEPYFLCGSAANLIDKTKESDQIQAQFIGQLAFELHKENHQTQNLNPIYLRSPKITKRKK
ncbi:MAG: tRNA (adenosine(37)-N6)-threonylcarbamoyltransferase complex dimerization subunit type 1 TsaB [Rickettsiales bacterium]|nr:tRNA (adenosine(37)-N6)-threonylcarbamoyltransferase complex dimerization subunit type 1 TsaB [Rickettsiales bacterium]